MSFPDYSALLQLNMWELISRATLVSKTVLAILVVASLLSWTLIFAKWSAFRSARAANVGFLRMFRKATGLEQVSLASEQFRLAPLVGVFEFGYHEVQRQTRTHSKLVNLNNLERTLQLGISEQITRLERHMNWLATVATVSPFIGLFGTVLGIIDAFQGLGLTGSASLRAVAPGISEALIATAMGLAAAIPAAVAYNHFGHVVEEVGTRMDDFSLELMNLAERTLEG